MIRQARKDDEGILATVLFGASEIAAWAYENGFKKIGYHQMALLKYRQVYGGTA
ncbi:MAG: hypothetical protein ACRBBQ_03505 [Cognatishimia sp.]